MLSIENVSVIFGSSPQDALTLMDQGEDRASILESTGQVIGVGDATVEIEEGQICVFMGLSGSGKSTLLRCFNGLHTPARGRVVIGSGPDALDPGNCSELELREIRRNRIAMVFQSYALLPWRTVRQNVALGLEISGLTKAEIDERVEEKLHLVELDTRADSPIAELSGGMQQRVGLARALATEADILLLDEPFSALDPIIRNGLQDELLALQSKLNKTIVFVTHDLDEALKLGNQVVIMDRGRIVQQGSPEQIVLNPANDYVKQFVSNMNPLNVFKASTVMIPLSKLPRANDRVIIAENKMEVLLNSKDEIVSVELDEIPVPKLDEPRDSIAKNRDLIIRDPETPVRELLEILANTSLVVIVCSGGRMLGIVRGTEILIALGN
ncbi:MAG TPA: choline ABC transporter ATP-binding protein [Candidatus Hydrogenedentes bacterium]|nr:choline ABC transporter ATP-binding protein [Candidatus Hydrogenedentota bacterium]